MLLYYSSCEILFLSLHYWADTLPWWWSLCVSMTQRAVPAGTLVPGRSNHARLVKGWWADEEQPPVLQVGGWAAG